jgi:hypothetical protein
MPMVPVVERACVQSEACKCAGTCTGYESRRECPPLIVLAVLVVSHASLALSQSGLAVN